MAETSARYSERVLFARVSRILRDVNLIGANVPADEYDPEADDIVESLIALARTPTTAEIAQICRAVFTRWFSAEAADELASYDELAAQIAAAWERYEAREARERAGTRR